MSSRLLKKFLKEKTRDEINKLGESVEEEAVAARPKKKSVFAYLDDSEGSEGSEGSAGSVGSAAAKGKQPQNSVSKKQSKNAANVKQPLSAANVKQPHNGVKAAQAQRKKKKKKKKNLDEEIDDLLHTMNAEEKQKAKRQQHENASDEEAPEGGGTPSEVDLPELSACAHEKYDYCLKLEKGNFDVNVELKRIFGKDFVKENKYIPKSKIKFLKNWLVQDYTTKIIHPPLSMKRYGNEFKLEKHKLYLEAENLFYALLDTHDIEAMHNLVKKFPFHVDTLLVLSEYYNESSNFEVANKFTKLALLILQHVFHIDFSPNSLNRSREIYVNPHLYDNKALFKALYMHMLSLENEACTITSLEVAKLLCKMDLQFDLCSILLRIDSLILKCNLFDFFIYFSFNFVIQNVQCVVPAARLSEILATCLHGEMRLPGSHRPEWDEHAWKRQDGGEAGEAAAAGGAVAVAGGGAEEGEAAEGESPSHNNQVGEAAGGGAAEGGAPPTPERRTDELDPTDDAKREPPNDADCNDGPPYQMEGENESELPVGHERHSADEQGEKGEQNEGDPLEGGKGSGGGKVSGGCNCFEGGRAGTALQSKLLFENFEIRLHFLLPNFAFSLPLSLYLKNNNGVDLQEIRLISVDDLVSAFSYEECRFLSPHFAIRFDCHGGRAKNGNDRLGQSDHAEDHPDGATPDESAPPKVSTNEQKKGQPSLSFSAHVTLLRALLCFPNFLQTFLNYNNFKTTKVVKKTIYESSFKDILASPPFSSPSLFRLGEFDVVQKIICCYLEKNNIYYKSERVITWFHVCSAFLHELYRDPSGARALDKARAEWHGKVHLLDVSKYKDVRVGEFKSTNYLLPDFMMEKNRTYSPHTPAAPSSYYVSLNSNLIIAFFQSLLPWYQVDYYGTHSRPVYFSTLIQNVVDETKRLFNFE
ncbi:transcription factor 25, putative [Plasmodium vivax]|uniref:Transcription factor 25, putative n=1 Tax=Plasmodium vivax TaxID=5855 RepID=A0A1G4HEG5_PLAVI|nr:transcription factor 25, putative [Plasmodium vivax]